MVPGSRKEISKMRWLVKPDSNAAFLFLQISQVLQHTILSRLIFHFQLFHQCRADPYVHHSTDTIGWDDSSDSRQAAYEPVSSDPAPSILPFQSTGWLSVVEI